MPASTGPRCCNRTEGNHHDRAGSHMGTGTNAVSTPSTGCVPHLAKLETHRFVGAQAATVAQLGVALWDELGCDAGADDAAAMALADHLTRARQQAPGAVALVIEQAPDRALGLFPVGRPAVIRNAG